MLVEHSEWLPKTFLLIDKFTGNARQVRLAWTGSNRAGVRYLDAGARAAPNGFGRRK